MIESGESYVILNTAADRTNTPLYPAAAAYLNAWWVQHPDRTRPAERPSLIGQGSTRVHVGSSRPLVATEGSAIGTSAEDLRSGLSRVRGSIASPAAG